jgi:hypothetical protein
VSRSRNSIHRPVSKFAQQAIGMHAHDTSHQYRSQIQQRNDSANASTKAHQNPSLEKWPGLPLNHVVRLRHIGSSQSRERAHRGWNYYTYLFGGDTLTIACPTHRSQIEEAKKNKGVRERGWNALRVADGDTHTIYTVQYIPAASNPITCEM